MSKRGLIIGTWLLGISLMGSVWGQPVEAVWRPLGASVSRVGISSTDRPSHNPSIALEPDGNPVVAWAQLTDYDWDIYIRRWNGAAWGQVGGFSAVEGGISNSQGPAINPSLAIDRHGRMYIAWEQSNTHIRIRRWAGSEWADLGESLASGNPEIHLQGRSGFPDLTLDASGTPYVVWTNWSSGTGQIYIRRWSGESWEEVGEGSASGNGISGNEGRSHFAMRARVAIDSDGHPVVAWANADSIPGAEAESVVSQIYVRRWNGSSWEEIGPESASGRGISGQRGGGQGATPDIAVDSDGNPIVTWWSAEHESTAQIRVLRWDGSAWAEIGENSSMSGGVSRSHGHSTDPVIVIEPDDNPVIAWCDGIAGSSHIFIRRWNGDEWEEIGEGSARDSGISRDGFLEYSRHPSLAIDGEGNLHIVWSHTRNQDSQIRYKTSTPLM